MMADLLIWPLFKVLKLQSAKCLSVSGVDYNSGKPSFVQFY